MSHAEHSKGIPRDFEGVHSEQDIAMPPALTETQQHLGQLLVARSVTAADALVDPVPKKAGWIRCLACAHRCRIPPGEPGICKVRFNLNGELRAPHGYVAALAVDPIEKKPFFHALPGAGVLSYGMLGCDLHCGYCQNWFTSQTLRDPLATAPPRDLTADELVAEAKRTGAQAVVSTYNEPLITSEWSHAIFSRAKAAGLLTGYVSNGNATPEVLDYMRPVTDLYKVDLKSFNDKVYRSLGTVLSHVLDTLEGLKARGFWVEVVTLLVPGLNDSEDEIRELTRWLARLDPMIPWHATAFHSDYRMQDTPDAKDELLLRAVEIGSESGLRYVYGGNRPGRVGQWEDTRCHGCGETVIRRFGFRILDNRLSAGGACPACQTIIPGVWQA
jgi:pyruvate formate lyase activating enzyme